MKIKLSGQIKGFSYRKDSVKMTLGFDALQLGSVAEILTLINTSFTLGIKTDDGNIVVKNVIYNGLNIGKDGDTKLKLDIEPEQLPEIKVLNKLKEVIDIVIAGGSK
ncbi:MAG: hypothetical protein WC934_13640 [Acidithiobacillus sp.]|jgi:hypothetical protein|uniref:hypothetical protein n=1 Tax=Acidithiobacillus sp. TaxID=1872118 RepID=UPI0035608164